MKNLFKREKKPSYQLNQPFAYYSSSREPIMTAIKNKGGEEIVFFVFEKHDREQKQKKVFETLELKRKENSDEWFFSGHEILSFGGIGNFRKLKKEKTLEGFICEVRTEPTIEELIFAQKGMYSSLIINVVSIEEEKTTFELSLSDSIIKKKVIYTQGTRSFIDCLTASLKCDFHRVSWDVRGVELFCGEVVPYVTYLEERLFDVGFQNEISKVLKIMLEVKRKSMKYPRKYLPKKRKYWRDKKAPVVLWRK